VSGHVLGVVLFAALLHASWNAAVKASVKESLPSTAIFIGAGIVAAFAVPFLPIPARASWPFLLGSVAVHCVYSVMLGRAYRLGDFSHAYPLMRGLPPLLTAVLMTVFSDERATPLQQAGMLALCGGILSLALEAGLGSPKLKHAAGWAVLVAVSIGVYTTLDGFGGRLSGSAFGYVAWTCLLEAVCLGSWLVARQGPATLLLVLRRWPITLVGGATTLAAYALVVWAMTQAPVALVAALRETSVVFAALLGVVVFKERLGPARILAIALVLAGIFLMRSP
jgi:drug/metabolite transporter (DMT)-like permease